MTRNQEIATIIQILYSKNSPWKSQPEIEVVNGKKEYFWRYISDDDAIEKLRKCSEIKEISTSEELTKFHGFGFDISVYSDVIIAEEISNLEIDLLDS